MAGDCLCEHPRRVHEHYRGGMDCAFCECKDYRRRRWWHDLLKQQNA